ncbi:MAG: nucleotidyl transferase AbiEii/AbiGii toxin family protein [Myxococcales bacterium]|nr:nucleotidyl transferase AbiEii/AbiGii toxin family protein [Myxococcales bacterium]
MLIGDPRHFTREHYEAHKGFAPDHLCELVVHCLELAAQLASTDLEFRFKGGNSQLILLEEPQRFSIDVDIVTTVGKEDLAARVQAIAQACDVFTHCEVRQHKTKPWLPMISFKLFFDSCYQAPQDAYVMLDAVLEPPPYGGQRRPVTCGSLYRSEVEVEVPSISGLIADKLLCIGPSTMGIPLGKSKEAQRLKHVFDVALLSGQPHDHAVMGEALGAIMAQENRIQKSAWSHDDVIADTRAFCRLPLQHEDRPADALLEPGTYLDEIARGFDGFRHHPFRAEYTWPRLRADCQRILDLLDALA